MTRPNESAERIVDVGLQDELATSYGRYAHTTILDRAIPDVRDGLKPVQRRILYAMQQSKNTSDKPYRKSAKTVGDVMGNFHPHGDQSIYDALVRLAQPWKMRHPLIDGHGNFGSLDDDPPAAMRYTEARLTALAEQLLADIAEDTVAFRPNFDESTLEPVVLPARYPNLLVNGTQGVSTGFATEIPPHNLGEVTEAVCLRLDEPDCTLDDVMAVLPGPDFPTGGILMGEADLREAYETGRGRVLVRARHTVDRGDGGKSLIVVSELPFGVVKADLIRQLDQIRQSRAVQGIADVRDESDREGLRVVVEVAKGADTDGIWNYLLKKTDLQRAVHFNMVVIAEHRPVTLGLLGLLDAYIAHRREVVRRRSVFQLARAEERLHIVAGLIRAVDILDEIVAVIRASRDREDARQNLVQTFAFTPEQAEAILLLRLYRLTNLQVVELRAEEKELTKTVRGLQELLASERRLDAVVERELRALAAQFGNPRRTEIWRDVAELKVSLEVRVKPQPVMVAVTERGYIKRSSVQSFLATGGLPEASGARDGDFPRFVLETNTTHRVLVFTARGLVFSLPVHALPEARWGEPGVALVNVTDFDMQQDRVVAVVAPAVYRSDRTVLFVTADGFVKQTPQSEFDLSRSAGAVAFKLRSHDAVVAVGLPGDHEDVLLATRQGQVIRFPLDQVSVQGRAATGVRGMGLAPGDAVVAAETVPPDDGRLEIVTFTVAGRAKRTLLSEYPRQHRAGKGVRGIRFLTKSPHEVQALYGARDAADLFLLFPSEGPPLRVPLGALRLSGRDGNAFVFEAFPEGKRLVAALPVLAAAGPGAGNGNAPGAETGPDEGLAASPPAAVPAGAAPVQLALLLGGNRTADAPAENLEPDDAS